MKRLPLLGERVRITHSSDGEELSVGTPGVVVDRVRHPEPRCVIEIAPGVLVKARPCELGEPLD